MIEAPPQRDPRLALDRKAENADGGEAVVKGVEEDMVLMPTESRNLADHPSR